MADDLLILIPVYNDWSSFQQLAGKLDSVLAAEGLRARILVVDDCSTRVPQNCDGNYIAIDSIELLPLKLNLGHQRAIAIGLVHAFKERANCVLVMDADGEDRPEDVPNLVAKAKSSPGAIVLAERMKRSESLVFRIFYRLYRLLFLLGTGQNVRHGNFCLLPRHSLLFLIHSPNTWNNIAASILRSKMPYERVATHRGHRIDGRSKMNFTSLLIHGLSALAVYLDIFTARLLICSVILFALLGAVVFGVIWIRLFTDLAIPGWATNVVGLTSIMLLQFLTFSAGVLFHYLNGRSQPPALPLDLAGQYASDPLVLFKRGPVEGN